MFEEDLRPIAGSQLLAAITVIEVMSPTWLLRRALSQMAWPGAEALGSSDVAIDSSRQLVTPIWCCRRFYGRSWVRLGKNMASRTDGHSGEEWQPNGGFPE
jgi:hypothetical protein